jgi:hypothetical protein
MLKVFAYFSGHSLDKIVESEPVALILGSSSRSLLGFHTLSGICEKDLFVLFTSDGILGH